jgi:hypothetical protein
MNIGHRVFVVEGESVTRISQKDFDRFYLRENAVLPQYAGRTVTFAVVFYEHKNRKPKRIIRIDTQRSRVKADGSLDQAHNLEDLRLAMNRMEVRLASPAPQAAPRSLGVVDAKARFDDRRWRQLHPALSGPVQKKILSALFGE